VVDSVRKDLSSADDVLEVPLRAAIISRVEAGAFDFGLCWLVSAREQVAQIEEIIGATSFAARPDCRLAGTAI
jgi:hypothetical protein